MIEINKGNAQEYIGKQVQVDIFCSSFGIIYPDINYLKSFDGETWVFESEDVKNKTWKWDQKDKDCEIIVYDFQEYQKAKRKGNIGFFNN